VKVFVRRSLYTRSLITGLLKFGSDTRVSSIPMFLGPDSLDTKRQILLLEFFFGKDKKNKQCDKGTQVRVTQKN
jgi:hypothetical protein